MAKNTMELNTRLTATDSASAVFINHRNRVKQVADEMDKLNKKKMFSPGALAQGMERTFNKIGNVAAVAATGIIAKVGYDILSVGKDFDDAMSSIVARVASVDFRRGTTAFKEMEDSARKTAEYLGVAPKEAASMYEKMAGLGMKPEAIARNAEIYGKFARVGGEDLGAGTSMLADMTAIKTQGMDVNDVQYTAELAKMADMVQFASKEYNATFKELYDYYRVAGQGAAAQNVDASQVLGIGGLLSNQGLKGSRGGTGLASIMTSLASPFGRTKEALDDLGIDFEKFYSISADGSSYVKDFAGLMTEVTDAASKVPEGDRGKIYDKLVEGLGVDPIKKGELMGMLFGKHHTKTAWALDSLGITKLRKAIAGIAGASGENDVAFQGMTQGTGFQIDQMRAQLDNELISMFKELTPLLKELMPILTGFFRDMTQFVKDNKDWIKPMVTTIAKHVPELLAAGLAFKVAALALAAAQGAGKIFPRGAEVAGELAGGGAKGLGKGAMGAGKGILKGLSWFGGGLLQASGLGLLGSKIVTALKIAKGPIIAAIGPIFSALTTTILPKIGAAIVSFFTGISAVAAASFAIIVAGIFAWYYVITNLINNWSDYVEYVFQPIWESIQNGFTSAIDWVSDKLKWLAGMAAELFASIAPSWMLDLLGMNEGQAPGAAPGSAPAGGSGGGRGEVAGNAAIKILVSGQADAPKSVNVPLYGELYRSGGV